MAIHKRKRIAVPTQSSVPNTVVNPGVAAREPKTGELSATSVTLRGVVLRKLSYAELQPSAPSFADPGAADANGVDIAINGRLTILPDTTTGRPIVELQCAATVRPAPTAKPVEIDLTMAALFSANQDVTTRQLLGYVSQNGGRLMFPYIREMVSSVSGRGIFGPIFMDPVVLGALLPEGELDRIHHAWSNPGQS